MKITKLFLWCIAATFLLQTACLTKGSIEKANALYQAGEFYQAAEKYKKIQGKVRDRKKKGEYYYKLGDCYKHMNQNKDAEKWLKKAVSAKYNNPYLFLAYADVLKINEKTSDAQTYYQEFQKLVPNDPRGKIGLESLIIDSLNAKHYIVENCKEFNSKFNDFCPSYGNDSYSELFFTSAREGSKNSKVSGVSGMYFTDIFVSRKDRAGAWSIPVPVSDTINSPVDEGASTMNSRFNTMYFTRCPKEKSSNNGAQIFESTYNGQSWGAAQKVLIIPDSSITVGHPTLSEDELTMFFVANLDSVERFKTLSKGGKDIWKVSRMRKNAAWSEPVNMGEEINTAGDEMFPFYYNDTTLFFSSNYHAGLGGLDIFKATKGKDGKWKIKNMGSPINSTADDFGFIMEKEQESGYFSSTRAGGKGGDDMYRFTVPPLVFSISGRILDESTGKPLKDAKLSMLGSNGTSFEKVTEADGAYRFEIKASTDYVLAVEKNQYFKGKGKETTKGLRESKELKLDIAIAPVPAKDTIIQVANIEYDLGKWDLRIESMANLDKLVEMLNNAPTLAIELRSHTDFRGSSESNDTLSQRRAQSVVDYLIKRRIEAGRLVAKGYGENKPLKVNADIAKKYAFLKVGDILDENFITKVLKTDEEREVAHQLNRRTEFKILSTDYKAGMKLEIKD